MLQRCLSCRSYRHPPSPICHSCLSAENEWVPASGQGTVYSFVIVREPLRGWKFEVPYVVAIIELAEGPHTLSNVVGIPVERFRIGMRVSFFFERLNEEISLPKFKPMVG